ncbi:putative TIM-barrel fold metal-dependent hydrolase [Bradyrhizobium japonicum]
MNVQFRESTEAASPLTVKTAIADCDIHPARATRTELYPYLAKRWQHHLEVYGVHAYQGMMEGPPYPKAQPNASRRDAYPPEGGPQGSSLSFMQKQLLDPNNVELGVLNPLNTGQGIRNHELSAALCSAINDWQIDKWTSKDKRLKASIVVGNEDGLSAAAEIRERAGDKNFVQVLLLSRNVEPLGQRRYWPIYQAAEEAGLPVGVHAFGFGGNPITPSGWPSYYIEEMVGHSQCQQSALASLVLEGVFERFPKLKMVMIEVRLRLGPVARLAARQGLAPAAQRSAACEAAAVGIYPRAGVVDHAADGGPGAARGSVRRHQMDRLGPIAVRDRLSALGL